jgi:hypothetical protein
MSQVSTGVSRKPEAKCIIDQLDEQLEKKKEADAEKQEYRVLNFINSEDWYNSIYIQKVHKPCV